MSRKRAWCVTQPNSYAFHKADPGSYKSLYYMIYGVMNDGSVDAFIIFSTSVRKTTVLKIFGDDSYATAVIGTKHCCYNNHADKIRYSSRLSSSWIEHGDMPYPYCKDKQCICKRYRQRIPEPVIDTPTTADESSTSDEVPPSPSPIKYKGPKRTFLSGVIPANNPHERVTSGSEALASFYARHPELDPNNKSS